MRLPKLFLIFTLLPSLTFAGGDPIKGIAKDLSKSIKKLKKPRVGLLAFPYHDGRVSSGSSIVPEKLTTYMVFIKGLRVVERSLILKLLEEQHISETGVIDPSTAKEMGRILGIDVIVTGTLIDLGRGKTEINARGLMADTGEIIAASQAVIKTTWSDRPRMIGANIVKAKKMKKSDKGNEAIEIGVPSRGGSRRRSLGRSYRGY